MKVQIKQNLIIFEEPYEWVTIRDQIKQEFGEKIFMISWRTKRELGFTVRHHKGLHPWETGVDDFDLQGRYYYAPEVHLDFYSESAQVFFMLKYLNLTD